MLLKSMLVAALMLAPLSAAQAQDVNENAPLIKAFFQDEVADWVFDEALLSAIRVRNVIDLDLTPEQIIEKDKQWRAEVGTEDHPLVDSVLNNDAADFLRYRVADSGGAITEVFIMDAHGLNVAASTATSDYWQGDEAKHAETYGKGVGAFHISELEIDDSTGVYQVQVSVTSRGPNTDDPIGAITVGLIAGVIL